MFWLQAAEWRSRTLIILLVATSNRLIIGQLGFLGALLVPFAYFSVRAGTAFAIPKAVLRK
jgi:hypothetical protein